MAEASAISWTDSTFNPWIGCTKVSTGPLGACEHCYAERDNKRRAWTVFADAEGKPLLDADGKRMPAWGAGAPRRRTKTWGDPLKWQREAEFTGKRPRVFCASLADVFDNEVPDEWRTDLWDLISRTWALRWMLLTKRIGNAPKMLPPDWDSQRFRHVGLMATLATQEEWDRDIDKLLAVPAAWRGVSAEPLLGPIDMGYVGAAIGLHWLIAGGESGAGFRYTDPQWVRDLKVQCDNADVAFHFKQWGGVHPKQNGCALDGREFKAFPAALAA